MQSGWWLCRRKRRRGEVWGSAALSLLRQAAADADCVCQSVCKHIHTYMPTRVRREICTQPCPLFIITSNSSSFTRFCHHKRQEKRRQVRIRDDQVKTMGFHGKLTNNDDMSKLQISIVPAKKVRKRLSRGYTVLHVARARRARLLYN